MSEYRGTGCIERVERIGRIERFVHATTVSFVARIARIAGPTIARFVDVRFERPGHDAE